MISTQQRYGISERRACKALGVTRSVQRYETRRPDDEQQLRDVIVRLAYQYGRYGYRRITALLRVEGWVVNQRSNACIVRVI